MSTRAFVKIVTVLIFMFSACKKTLCAGFGRFPRHGIAPLLSRRFSVQIPVTLENNALFADGVSFKDISVSEPLLAALSAQGLMLATPVQKLSYSPIKSGLDVIIGAETGSGKTLAYLLPLIDAYLSLGEIDIPNYPCGVVLAPTKELCWQIEDMARGVAGRLQEQGVRFRIGTVRQSNLVYLVFIL